MDPLQNGWPSWEISGEMCVSVLVAAVMVAITVLIHYFGLVMLLGLLRGRPKGKRRTPLFSQGEAIRFIVFCLMALHTIEIWSYAGLYLLANALPDLETALYFSTASFTTVGYGDIVLAGDWRIVGAIESANGLLLFGWSTAFLTITTTQLSMLEHNWLQGAGEPPKR